MSLLHHPHFHDQPLDVDPDDARRLASLVGELRRQVYALEAERDDLKAENEHLRQASKGWWRRGR